MMRLDKDALLCDLAETYQIYDYRQLPLNTVAVFSCGLRDSSRIKMKLNDQKVSLDTLILASIRDTTALLLWSKTKDAQKNINKPTPIVPNLLREKQRNDKVISFRSGEDFDFVRNNLINNSESEG
ncbi:DUF5361 domain-containing protein [Enterococcus sp. LJL120]